MRVLVTGGTGVLGREVVQAACRAGHQVRSGSRRPAAPRYEDPTECVTLDVTTGDGISAAMSGVECVVHTITNPRHPDAVDVRGTQRLVEAARDAGVRHFIHVSIVGIDRIPLGYYRRKLQAEDCVGSSRVPWSILRVTQFHTLVDSIVQAAARVPVYCPLPAGLMVQSVAPADVATRVLRCVEDGPGGRLPDFGGPVVLTLAEAAAQWLIAHGVSRRVVSVPLPGRAMQALREGANTAPHGERGLVTWEDWLRGVYRVGSSIT